MTRESNLESPKRGQIDSDFKSAFRVTAADFENQELCEGAYLHQKNRKYTNQESPIQNKLEDTANPTRTQGNAQNRLSSFFLFLRAYVHVVRVGAWVF